MRHAVRQKPDLGNDCLLACLDIGAKHALELAAHMFWRNGNTDVVDKPSVGEGIYSIHQDGCLYGGIADMRRKCYLDDADQAFSKSLVTLGLLGAQWDFCRQDSM